MRQQPISGTLPGPVDRTEFLPIASKRSSDFDYHQRLVADLHPDCRALVAFLDSVERGAWSRRAVADRLRMTEYRTAWAAGEVMAFDIQVAELYPELSWQLLVLNRCFDLFALQVQPDYRAISLPLIEVPEDLSQGVLFMSSPRFRKGGRR